MDVKRILHGILAGILILAFIVPDLRVYAQGVISLPEPGVGFALSPAFSPVLLKGIKVRLNDPFRFDFILDKGDGTATAAQIKADATRLIKYFLASLTIPESDLWVNLSPYEKDRIIPDAFGQTGMGRDLLVLDYLLKKTMAMLLHPDGAVGKKFWEKLYARAYEVYGTTDIPIDTFNKVWITTDSAEIYARSKDEGTPVQAAVAFVTATHLKVMLESDYVALSHQRDRADSSAPAEDVALSRTTQGADAMSVGEDFMSSRHDLEKNVLREIIIPVLEKEVNEGRDFSQLRQIYTSLVLATWYKKELTNALVTRVYADQGKVAGITHHDPGMQQRIWDSYAETFRKGVYNLIREEVDPASGETIPRKYFSGGVVLHGDYATTQERPSAEGPGDYAAMTVDLAQDTTGEATTLNDILGPSAEQAVMAKYFSRGKLPSHVRKFLSGRNELVRDNNTKEFVRRLMDIMETVGPDVGNMIIDFMRGELGGKFLLKDLVDPGVLSVLFRGDKDTQALLEMAVEENDPRYIGSALADFFKKEFDQEDDFQTVTRAALLLRCLYGFPQERVPLVYLTALETSGILELFRYVHRNPALKGQYSFLTPGNPIVTAILENNGPELVRLINEIPCPPAKKAGLLLPIKKMLAHYGYPLVAIDVGSAADNTLPASDPLPINISLHGQLSAMEDILSDTGADQALVLKAVLKILEDVKETLSHDPHIYKELVASFQDELVKARSSYLQQLAIQHKDNEDALFVAVTQAETAMLLGFDETDIVILKAFHFLKRNKTNPTMERIIKHLKEASSEIDTATLEKISILKDFFTGMIALDLQEEHVIYAKEARTLRDFDIDQFYRNNIEHGFQDLVIAMMEETGADKESVQNYLTSKKIFPNGQMALLNVNEYPVLRINSSFVNERLLKIMTRDVKDAIRKILDGVADGNQHIPFIYRTTLGNQKNFSIYVRINGVIGNNELRHAGLADIEIKDLLNALANKENSLISALNTQARYTFRSGDITKFSTVIKKIIPLPQVQENVINLIKTSLHNREVVIVAFGARAKFKMRSDTNSMLHDFEQHLNNVSTGTIEPLPVYADQAMSLEKDLGGIDLDPAAAQRHQGLS